MKCGEGSFFQFLISGWGALRTRGESTDNKEENENINKGPFTKFIHFTRVSMDKKEENEILTMGPSTKCDLFGSYYGQK